MANDGIVITIKEWADDIGIVLTYGQIDDLARGIMKDWAPVVHGHWILKRTKGSIYLKCSACGMYADTRYLADDFRLKYLTPYCPKCGAKLDERPEEK